MEKLVLSPSEKEELIKVHSSLKDKRLADRVKCILLLNSGYTHQQIGEILLLNDRTIARYKESYAEGLDNLLELNYKGRIPKLNKQQELELIDHLENNLYSTSKEIVSYIKTTYGVDFTSNGVVITLHRLGFSHKNLW